MKKLIFSGLFLASSLMARDLHICTYTDITGFDPHDTNDAPSYGVQSGIFERLFEFDKDMKLLPKLAKSYSANHDATEFVIELREGIFFHDDSPFDAEVVKANIDRLKDQSKGLKRNTLLKMVSEVKVINPYKVMIRLDESFGAFINTLAHPAVAMHSLASLEKDASHIRLNPVGTGPFKLVSWESGKSIKLEKFANYHEQGWPKVDNVYLRPYSEDASRVAGLRAGQCDAIYPLPSDLLETVQKDPKLEAINSTSIYMTFITLNTRKAPTNNLSLRQALNYAIDKDLWLKVIYQNLGTVASAPIAPGVQFYSPQKDPYKYNPKKAQELLAQAGFKDGLSLSLWTSNQSVNIKSAQFIKQQLNKIGVKVEIEPMDSGTRNERVWAVKDPELASSAMVYTGWGSSTSDADWALRPLFATESFVPKSYNVAYFSNKDTDLALQEGLATADLAKRQAAYDRAQKSIWDNAPAIFLGSPDHLLGQKKGLSGVHILADLTLIYSKAQFK